MSDKNESKLEEFSNEQVIVALLKSRGIHSGFWSLAVRFGFGAAYAKSPDGEQDRPSPAAIVAVGGLALRVVSETDPNAFNAARANPEPGREMEENPKPLKRRARKAPSQKV